MRFPKSKVSLDVGDWILEVIAASGILALVIVVIVKYPSVPDLIPIHFNSDGAANRTGEKSNLLGLPLVGIVTYVLLTAAHRFPQLINYPFEFSKETAEKHFQNALRLMRVLKCLITTGALYLTFTTIQIATGKANDLGTWFLPIAILSIVITTAGFLYRGYKIG